MSKNIDQVFIANPITANLSTDLMYFGQSPYASGNDAAMLFSDFSVQFGAPYTAAALTKVNDTNVTLTLAGTPNTALLNAVSLTMGWTGTLSVARGGIGSGSLTAHGVLLGQGTSAITSSVLAAGQILIGTTASDPSAALITGSGNITVTSSTGAINISATGSASFAWNAQATTPQTAAVNNGYIITDASIVTITLPVTAPVGSVVAVVGNGAGGWILAPGAGQTIKLGSQSASTSIASTNQFDCIEVICVVANTTWVTRSAFGNLTFV